MSDSEKDRFGDKLHDIEAARENEWARKRDQELLEKMRRGAQPAPAAPKEPPVCPDCSQPLVANTDPKVGGMVCPNRHGAWFGWETVARIMEEFAHQRK